MKLSSSLLYECLSEHMNIVQRGIPINTLSLSPPVFYNRDMDYTDNMVYIGRIDELPPPDLYVHCLIICVGGTLPHDWPIGRSCSFSIESNIDILFIFNKLQEIYIRYSNWHANILHILETTADINEMIRITAELMGRAIVMVDNKLNPVVFAGSNEEELLSLLLPENVHKFANFHRQNTSIKEPFLYTDGEKKIYCINIFINDIYWGILSLVPIDSVHPITNSDKIIFQFFFKFLHGAIRKNEYQRRNGASIVRNVYRELLDCMPVTEQKLEEAELRNSGSIWHCLAAMRLTYMKNIPQEYSSKQLEMKFPGLIAIEYGDYVAVLISDHLAETDRKNLFWQLQQALSELNMRAGCSFPFSDIRNVHYAFQQAVIALNTAVQIDADEDEVIFYFKRYAIFYSLKNSVGELNPLYFIPDELLSLKIDDDAKSDLWETLKVYLENEMNVSETARSLYIHRSTLQFRLRKIKEHIDLSTPEARMYTRYCIYLYELYQANEKIF